MDKSKSPRVLKRTPHAWKKTAIVKCRIWNYSTGRLAEHSIDRVFQLISLVNRTSNYLSRLTHKRRIFNKMGMSEAFKYEVMEYMPCTGRIFDMACVKVSRAYRDEIASGRGFLMVRKPLKWTTKDPIFVPQRILNFREVCHVRLPTLYGRGSTVRALFGRYKNRKMLERQFKMTGQARLYYKGGFWLDFEVPVEDGAVFEETCLGVDQGVLATLYASHVIAEKIREIREVAQARIKVQEEELRVILNKMREEARNPSSIKIYDTVTAGIKEMVKSGEFVGEAK